MKIVDGIFDYKVDSYSGRMSSCQLRVYQYMDEIAIVIATEITNNPGPSITNSAEAWATEAVAEYGLDPLKTHFIEHYDHRTSALRDPEDTSYDFVGFEWHAGIAEKPKWKHATREEIEKLIGESLL